MKLKELLNKINKQLENIKGIKFNNAEQLRNTIIAEINEVETELSDLLRIDDYEIRLIEEKDLNTFGSVGEVLFKSKADIKADKRVKYERKGVLLDIQFNYSERIKELAEFELIDLQQYINELDRLDSIKWYNKEIDRLKDEIGKLENERNALMNKGMEK